ncbi:hypothetical protein PHYPSEUDO_008116 [Phytophthora pseudosyringae]|uniref:MtN3-like protein n=1 Tax=Phytophthora pseudosyringae TaxID=221518 RepID=A0A8T1VK27_9STRA|nr:hypothetical protein PHYPSEUDO_008116 [Phytophthora pseudosyringae]
MFARILRVLSAFAAILAVLAPFPDFWRIYKTRSTGSVSVLPVVLIFCNCYAWVLYAHLVNSIPPLFVAYPVASIGFGGFIITGLRTTHMHKLYGVVFYVLAGFTLYCSLGTSGATGQSIDAVGTTLGALINFFTCRVNGKKLSRRRTRRRF